MQFQTILIFIFFLNIFDQNFKKPNLTWENENLKISTFQNLSYSEMILQDLPIQEIIFYSRKNYIIFYK